MDLTDIYRIYWASSVAQLVKNPPAMWETWVQYLDWEDTWRRERQPTPVFWPGEFHVLYSPWGHKELDTTEQLSLHFIGYTIQKQQRAVFLTCTWTFSWIYPILGHKASLRKFKKIEIEHHIKYLFQQQCNETRNQLQRKNCKKHKHVKAKQYIKQTMDQRRNQRSN